MPNTWNDATTASQSSSPGGSSSTAGPAEAAAGSVEGGRSRTASHPTRCPRDDSSASSVRVDLVMERDDVLDLDADGRERRQELPFEVREVDRDRTVHARVVRIPDLWRPGIDDDGSPGCRAHVGDEGVERAPEPQHVIRDGHGGARLPAASGTLRAMAGTIGGSACVVR